MNKSIKPGDGVVWHTHHAKPRAVVLRRVYGHFVEIELKSPIDGWARRVRVVDSAVTRGDYWDRHILFTCACSNVFVCGHHGGTAAYKEHERLKHKTKFCNQFCVEHGLWSCRGCATRGRPNRCKGI